MIGARPTVTVSHKGTNGCDIIAVSFSIAHDIRRLCDRCGVRYRGDAHGINQLRRIAIECSDALMTLPAVAAVVPRERGEYRPGFSDDPRLVIAVLSRCSKSVFIRGKSPLLSSEILNRPLAIVLPREHSEQSV